MKEHELLQRVKDILRIPSASSFDAEKHMGNIEVGKYLAEWVKEDLDFKLIPSSPESKDVTFICWPKGYDFPSSGGLALNTHLDTVQAGELKKWTDGGPFESREIDGQIVGLGAADVKSDAICKIAALIDIARTNKFRILPFFVGSFAEEVGMQGARWLTEHKLIQPHFALVGEPSANLVSYANKGLFLLGMEIEFSSKAYSGKTYEINYTGNSGHSSAPHKATNALELALDDLPFQIRKNTPIGGLEGSIAPNVIPGHFRFVSTESIIPLEILERLSNLRKSHRAFQDVLKASEGMEAFDPPFPSSSWTMLERKSDSIKVGIEGRFLPEQKVEDLIQDFLNREPELKLERSSPACFQSRSGQLSRIISEISPAADIWITKSGSNESYYYQQMGAEVFVHGPGQSYGNIHRPNEKIEISSILEAYRFYREVIKRLCLS